jgi:hypothetical protein
MSQRRRSAATNAAIATIAAISSTPPTSKINPLTAIVWILPGVADLYGDRPAWRPLGAPSG